MLAAPGPDPAVLEPALAASLRPPGHGGLQPWRFVATRPRNRARKAEPIGSPYGAERHGPHDGRRALQIA
jgi:nitroreductase